MDFKRKIYQKLLDWKKKWNGKTAILLEGARRIGKSTVVENFAKNEYKSYILVDFLYDSKKITSLFENAGEYGLDILFNKLEKAKNKKLYERQSVIIFDEVQKCPKARQLIKYLVADGRYDYIETGSLISIKQNVEGINIPSEEIKVKMYPMDFEEFLWALNKNEILKTIKQCYLDKKPLTDKQHQEAMYWFRQYMVLGGMPQSVLYFI